MQRPDDLREDFDRGNQPGRFNLLYCAGRDARRLGQFAQRQPLLEPRPLQPFAELAYAFFHRPPCFTRPKVSAVPFRCFPASYRALRTAPSSNSPFGYISFYTDLFPIENTLTILLQGNGVS